MTHTDPSGMYVCADSTKSHLCASAADKSFAASLGRDLNSRDAAVRRAALAYGKVNEDNGVTVKFGDPGKGRDAVTNHDLGADPNNPEAYRADETVTLRNNLSGSVLDAAVGHEGSHVADAQAFAASVTPAGAYDSALNLTTYDTETRAFHVTAAVLGSEGEREVYAGGLLGSGISPAATDATIQRILGDPKGIYNVTPTSPGAALFPLLGVPH